MLLTPAFAGLIQEERYESELHPEFQAQRDPVSKQSEQTPHQTKTNRQTQNCMFVGGGGRGGGHHVTLKKFFQFQSTLELVRIFRLEKAVSKVIGQKNKIKSEKL